VKRADIMIKNAESIGVPPLVRPADITSGNTKILTVFVAELFNTKKRKLTKRQALLMTTSKEAEMRELSGSG
jgi:hypothetical protein